MDHKCILGIGSVAVVILRPNFRVAQTKLDVISIFMNLYKYVYNKKDNFL